MSLELVAGSSFGPPGRPSVPLWREADPRRPFGGRRRAAAYGAAFRMEARTRSDRGPPGRRSSFEVSSPSGKADPRRPVFRRLTVRAWGLKGRCPSGRSSDPQLIFPAPTTRPEGALSPERVLGCEWQARGRVGPQRPYRNFSEGLLPPGRRDKISGITVGEVSVCMSCDSPGKVRPHWDPITLMRLLWVEPIQAHAKCHDDGWRVLPMALGLVAGGGERVSGISSPS